MSRSSRPYGDLSDAAFLKRKTLEMASQRQSSEDARIQSMMASAPKVPTGNPGDKLLTQLLNTNNPTEKMKILQQMQAQLKRQKSASTKKGGRRHKRTHKGKKRRTHKRRA
jgi:hypothetical protein